MGLCEMVRLLMNTDVKRSTRLYALVNIAGCLYCYMMLCIAFYLGLWQVIPVLSHHKIICYYNHVIAVLYLTISVVGNYSLTYFTDCSIKTLYTQETEAGKLVRSKDIKDGLHTCKTFYCKKCDVDVPERCHHCKLCQICILKRDHHCFFMAKCIGYHNQRYFTIFCFYMLIAAVYGIVLLAMYIHHLYRMESELSILDVLLFLPKSIVDVVFGADSVEKTSLVSITFYYMFLVGLFYGGLGAGLSAGAFFYWQMSLIVKGQTTFEFRKNITRFKKTLWVNYKDVFGKHWLLCWFLPIKFAPMGNGIYLK